MTDALSADADNYYRRNTGQHQPTTDPVLPTLDRIHAANPIRSVLEIGSNTGWRLAGIRDRYRATVEGVEASSLAVTEHRATHPEIPVTLGVAPAALTDLPARQYDTVILGFLIYLLPRDLLFALAAETDRILAAGGHLIVEDFLHPTPTSSDYTHHPDLRVHKHDPTSPWTWSPTYTLIDRQLIAHEAHHVDNRDPARWITVDAVRKHPLEVAYPPRAALPSRTAP